MTMPRIADSWRTKRQPDVPLMEGDLTQMPATGGVDPRLSMAEALMGPPQLTDLQQERWREVIPPGVSAPGLTGIPVSPPNADEIMAREAQTHDGGRDAIIRALTQR